MKQKHILYVSNLNLASLDERYTTPMLVRILPPLRVHCWGGLGSQLFAWALIEEIKKKYPKRRVKLILHQSGVTKRVEEIARFFPGEFSIREDFDENDSSSVNQHSIKFVIFGFNLFKFILVTILTRSRIICSCNTDSELNYLRPWTLEIRGHYSYRVINKEIIESMNFKAESKLESLLTHAKSANDDIAIQYRLGDLLTLSKKSPIHPSRLSNAVISIEKSQKVDRVVVFSDSPELAINQIKVFGKKLISQNENAWNTLRDIQNFKYFIATNSKISIWAILIRIHFFPDVINYAPLEFKEQLYSNLSRDSLLNLVNFY